MDAVGLWLMCLFCVLLVFVLSFPSDLKETT